MPPSKQREYAERPTDFTEIGLKPLDSYAAVLSVLGEEELMQPLTGLTQPLMRLWLESIEDDYRLRFPDDKVTEYTKNRRYNECARRVGHVLLGHYESHPGDYFVSEVRLWAMTRDRLEELVPIDHVTTFQWGWGINAARYCLGFEAMPNPALRPVRGQVALLCITREEMEDFLH